MQSNNHLYILRHPERAIAEFRCRKLRSEIVSEADRFFWNAKQSLIQFLIFIQILKY